MFNFLDEKHEVLRGETVVLRIGKNHKKKQNIKNKKKQETRK